MSNIWDPIILLLWFILTVLLDTLHFGKNKTQTIVELKNGPKYFIVDKEDVERKTIDPRNELTGKHMDTKIEFNVNSDK